MPRCCLLDAHSVGDDLHKLPGDLAVVKSFDHALAARFSHAAAQSAVLHEQAKVRCDVGHAGSVFNLNYA